MDSWILAGLLAPPVAAALACLLLRSARAVLAAAAAGALLFAVAVGFASARVFSGAPISAAGSWLWLDALSAWHLLVMAVVFGLSALFAFPYFGEELRAGRLPLRTARQYGALWSASLAAMALTLISNNLGMMWIGIEATTLLTAFLICVHVSPTSLEAMWKYLLVCSVGVAFAFVGTLFTGSAASRLALGPGEALLWTHLSAKAGQLNPAAIKLAFVFLLVGYGTKAGLAPMHSWLPDAHSQAPAPVSAIFSGFMLNAALYCLMRYLPLVDAATGGSGWGRDLLMGFGLVSVVVAAAFIVFQRDVKRLLAYSSVEHLGVMALGVGLGGLGAFAALFHMLAHSTGKSLAFFSAGRVGQHYRTHDIGSLGGSLRGSPLWGLTLFGSLLALIGAAPFAPFMSELMIVKAAVASRAWWTTGIFLVALAIAFVGALRHAMTMAWGEPKVAAPEIAPAGHAERALALAPMALLLVLGLWMPDSLRSAIDQAAAVVGGGR